MLRTTLGIALLLTSAASAGPFEKPPKAEDYTRPFLSYGEYLEVRNAGAEICAAAYDNSEGEPPRRIVDRAAQDRKWNLDQREMLDLICLIYLEGKMVAAAGATMERG
jgi:hypothetical protein